MSNNFNLDENIEKNKWLLDKQLTWISNGDIKIGAIVTLNLAMLAGLAAFFNAKDALFLLDILYTITAISIIVGICFCKMGFKPKFSPPNESNIFFGTIIKKDLTAFIQEIDNLTKEDFSKDLANQVHRNAHIACIKYQYLSKATLTLVITSILWAVTIGGTLFTNKYLIIEKKNEKSTTINVIKN
ncbi:Pycsar system effector family protein [Acinetobacter oleivorans]|uniref:Pycsar system effector family protein n=1 Tax=Acinetobacter oleivorans TaxID=1148157 RepID=UPI003A8B8BAA